MVARRGVNNPRGWVVSIGALALAALAVQPDLGAAPGQRPDPKVARVDFDRDVRPILAESCFACHGFDANKRQAGLRLDVAEGSHKPAPSGRIAIVPGKPASSELVRRVTAASPGLRMPPAAAGKKLTPDQVATLKRWVEQGGDYQVHWAFVAPIRPPVPGLPSVWKSGGVNEGTRRRPVPPRSSTLPHVRTSTLPPRPRDWPRNPIDAFVLRRILEAGMRPSPEADRYTLIRRVTFDLTGLPPTLEETDAFVSDRSPDAYEKLVDRLLASPHFGERMALKWLDLARYADTHGYHIDSHRDMWPWRDWVIRAYDANMPFDQFAVEQLAGDLLSEATLDQKIATGFNRNHPINYEGGAIPEEYLNAYVVDRVDTAATVFMALTAKCAQCHDHKYEPLSQRDFYRFYAYFNNNAEQGLDGQKGNAAPFLKVPTAEQARQLAALDDRIASLDTRLKARAGAAAGAQAEWERQVAGNSTALAAVTAGLVAHLPLDERDGDRVTNVAPQQSAGTVHGRAVWSKGRLAGALDLDGDTHVDLDAGAAFDRTDRFSYGAWVRPTGKDHMTVLSRMDDAAGFRGWDLYLGDDRVYAHLVHQWEANAIRVNTKQPVPADSWAHLFVTYDGSSKAKGLRIYLNGKVAELETTHDTLSATIKTEKPLRVGRRHAAAPFKGRIDDVRLYDRELAAAEVQQLAGAAGLAEIVATPAEKRTAEQMGELARYYLETQDGPYRKLSSDLAATRTQQTELDNRIPTTMVMRELEKPRETAVLVRGQYDKKGEKVTCGTPEFLALQPPDAPGNRLGLARWLASPENPLTARVAVNRHWEMLFGSGLVRTTENFGTQGERPSHPELLDWLAVRFARGSDGAVEPWSGGLRASAGSSGSNTPTLQHSNTPTAARPWDVKALLRLIVTSATYRQSSSWNAAQSVTNRKSKIENRKSSDPENRLLARGPRFRLPAEFIRDQALAASGLLVRQVGGPSVKPYHPPGLWEEMAFGGEFTAQKYEQDHGDALYRRSMYTFWKRTVPPPALQTFDAPEREFCMPRRSVTNTPLQALVLMNDATYVEAARHLAEKVLTGPAAAPRERLVHAFRLLLTRPPSDAELTILQGVLDEQLAIYRTGRPAAERLLAVGESKRNQQLDIAEHAAWTALCSVLLNLDETITKG